MLRMKRAFYQLVFNQQYPTIDISMEAGFDNPESFSRVFSIILISFQMLRKVTKLRIFICR